MLHWRIWSRALVVAALAATSAATPVRTALGQSTVESEAAQARTIVAALEDMLSREGGAAALAYKKHHVDDALAHYLSDAAPRSLRATYLSVLGLASLDAALNSTPRGWGELTAARDAVRFLEKALPDLDRASDRKRRLSAQEALGRAAALTGENGDDVLATIKRAFSGALSELSRETEPIAWARMQATRAAALEEYSRRARKSDVLLDAFPALEAALAVVGPEDDLALWTRLVLDYGEINAFGPIPAQGSSLDRALALMREAKSLNSGSADAQLSRELLHGLGSLIAEIGRRREDSSMLREAIELFLGETERVDDSRHAADAAFRAGTTLHLLNDFTRDRRDLEQAVTAYEEAHRLYKLAGDDDGAAFAAQAREQALHWLSLQ